MRLLEQLKEHFGLVLSGRDREADERVSKREAELMETEHRRVRLSQMRNVQQRREGSEK